MNGTWLRPAPMRAMDVGERRSTWLELFFDLCFVAAVAALADGLAHDPTVDGLLVFLGLFVTVWWAWMSFTWFATAWDNDDAYHRLGMLVAMLLVLALAAGVPGVLEGDDALYVAAYAGMQFTIVALFARVLPHAGPATRFAQIYLGAHLVAGLMWLASLAVPQPARYWVWAAAIVWDMVMPVFAVRAYEGQPFDSRHIPERYGLFTIIVLGESVVAVVVGLTEVSLNIRAAIAAVGGFAIAASIWWAYFETVSSAVLSRARLVASFLWGYGHFFAYVGIAAAAVGIDLSIVHAAEGSANDLGVRLMLFGGPASFLLALAAIHAATVRAWDAVLTRRAVAIGVLIALVGVGARWAPGAEVAAALAVMVVTVVLDVRAAGGRGLAAADRPDEPRRIDTAPG